MRSDEHHNNLEDLDMESRILAAAENLFLQKGFKATTTTEIAKIVGCNQALVHYYFRTKEKLFEKVFQTKIMIFADSFLGTGDSDGTFDERMIKRIGAHYDIMRENPRLPLFIINELVSNPSRLEALKSVIGDMPELLFKRLQNEIDVECARGSIKPIKAIDLFLNILSLNAATFIFCPVIQVILNKDRSEIESMITHRRELIIDIILKSLH